MYINNCWYNKQKILPIKATIISIFLATYKTIICLNYKDDISG